MSARFVSVVLVDSSLVHRDRVFTYRVPDELTLQPGSVVRVPFHGKRRTGVVVAMLDRSDVPRTVPVAGTLGPGIDPEMVDLARWVANRYLATLGETLAAILPARVASEERANGISEERASENAPSHADGGARAFPPERGPRRSSARAARDASTTFRLYENGPALLATLDEKSGGRFVWHPLGSERRGDAIAGLVSEALARGRGSLVLLPEVNVEGSVASSLREAFGDAVAWLSSDRSHRERYRDWLALREGRRQVAVGGRGTIFAPIANLGLIVIDDEGHASYKEGRAPRFHARAVAAERARSAGAMLLLVGIPPSVEARAATERGPYRLIAAPRTRARAERAPVTTVETPEREGHLVPSPRTLSLATSALRDGKRVVFIAHRGEAASAAVADRIRRTLAPRQLARLDAQTPRARFARALRDADCICATPVVAKDLVLEDVGLLALLEGDAALAQPGFRATEETFSTWWRAARWVVPAGRVVVETADPSQPAVAALLRWDPDVLWRAEAARRRELGYPPFATLARIDVPAERARDVARELSEAAGPGVEVLGPVERTGAHVVVVRARRRDALLASLRPVADAWRERDEPMRVDVDPWEVLVPKWRSSGS